MKNNPGCLILAVIMFALFLFAPGLFGACIIVGVLAWLFGRYIDGDNINCSN